MFHNKEFDICVWHHFWGSFSFSQRCKIENTNKKTRAHQGVHYDCEVHYYRLSFRWSHQVSDFVMHYAWEVYDDGMFW